MSGDFTFLKGNVETIILCSLYNTDKYGYEIAKEIKDRSDNKYEIKQPTLYAYLKRLEDDGLIVSYWGESSNGGRRRYYKLTEQGKSDCQQFMAEWQYHKDVLTGLVENTDNEQLPPASQVTPLFGKKTSGKKRTSKKEQLQQSFDEQDEIARRLKDLASVTSTSDTEKNNVVETNNNFDNDKTEHSVVADKQESVATPLAQETFVKNQTITQQVDTSRFDVNQDKAEDFLAGFDVLAQEVALRQPTDADEGENYQHVLLGMMGEQLDQVDSVVSAPSVNNISTFYEDNPTALEEVADSLAKEGVRVRIFNHATAIYKSKMLIPLAKVLCQTAWLTYAVALVYFGILALIGANQQNSQPFIICAGILFLAPCGFTVNAIWDPTRKDKPSFNFKLWITASSIACAVVVLVALAVSVLAKIEFSNFVDVSRQILIPVGIAILLPSSILSYWLLYKQY